MKNVIKYLVIGIICLVVGGAIGFLIFGNEEETKIPAKLPAQEKSEGLRGVYDIDKNINEKTIDKYLGRSDVAYRDVRMLEDTATWENKGGERILTGFVEGFEVIPYAYLTEFPQEYVDQKKSENVSGLYEGKTLFRLDEKGNYVANYKESMEILETIFPKNKTIFLMCGAGGYANFTKQMLGALGWDTSKIYNVGGYWNYNGKKSISTKTSNGKYDFSKVPYHNIDFDRLTEVE